MADTEYVAGTGEVDLDLDLTLDVDPDFAAVPDPEPDAEVDPNWLRLRGGSPDLPALYMPPSMPGRHSAGLRAVAVILVAVFVAATAAGVCLTYGAPHRPF